MLATIHVCYDYLLDFYRGGVPFLFLIKVHVYTILRRLNVKQSLYTETRKRYLVKHIAR